MRARERRKQLAVLDPSVVYSFMSYCRGEGPVAFTWMDGYHHGLLIGFINGIDWSEGPQPSDGSWWEFFSGDWTSAPSDGAAAQTRVAPTLRLQPTSTPTETSGDGDYVLEMLDAQDQVLRSVPFAATVSVDNTGPQQTATPMRERWVLAIKDPPDYDSYRIKRLSQVIATMQRSAAAPVVSVTSPTAGQVLDTEAVQFSWTATDADGDDLTYLVQYSADAGSNYRTIAVDLDSMTLRRDRNTLAGSTQAKIRVVASDGARSTVAESAVFTLAESPPEVSILSPGGGSLVAGPRTLLVEASARDAEDGRLDGFSIGWTSSLDGALGTGATIEVAAADLSEGTHTITATAIDSSSMQASASATVTVRRDNRPPVPRRRLRAGGPLDHSSGGCHRQRHRPRRRPRRLRARGAGQALIGHRRRRAPRRRSDADLFCGCCGLSRAAVRAVRPVGLLCGR